MRGPGAIAQMPMTQIGWGWFGRLLGRGRDTSVAAGGSAALGNFGALTKATGAGALAGGKFDLSLGNIRKTLSSQWHMGGLARTIENMTRLRDVTGEARAGLGDVARLLPGGEILAGLGTAGGIAAGMVSFGVGGQNLANTAEASGVTTRALQDWRGAAELEGGTRADADASLKGVNRTLLNANAGLDAKATQLANMLQVSTKTDPATFLMSLAGSRQFQTASAAAQQNVLDVFGVTPGLQPLLRKGTAGIKADISQTERNQFLPDAAVQQASDLGKGITSARQAVGGLATAIEARRSPALTPMLKNFTEWLDELKQSPAAMDRVVKGGEVLAAVLGVTAVGAVAKLVAAVTTGSASMLASPLGILLMAGAGAAEMVSAIKQGGLSGFLKSLLLPKWLQPAGTPHPTIGGAVGGLFGSGSPAFGPPIPGTATPPGYQPGAAVGPQGDLSKGGAADRIAAAIMQVESKGGTAYNAEPYPGHSATGPMQIIPSTFAEYAKPGERLDNPADNINVGHRYIQALINKGYSPDQVAYSYANGSPVAPDRNPGYVGRFDRAYAALPTITNNVAQTPTAPPAMPAAIPAAPSAPTQKAPPIGAIGTGGDAAGTGDTATGYGPRGPLGQTTVYGNGNQDFAGGTPGFVPVTAPGDLAAGGAADTNHNVNINLTGAPAGTRMAVNGTGPATVKTTTQFESSW